MVVKKLLEWKNKEWKNKEVLNHLTELCARDTSNKH